MPCINSPAGLKLPGAVGCSYPPELHLATKQLVAVKQQLVEVVGVAGDAEGGAERGCEVPDGLAASAGVAHKAPGWHQVNSK